MTQNDTVTAWADMVLDIWHKRMSDLGIKNESGMANSLAYTIIGAANGDIMKIQFAFDYVLKFTDMGVGKGIKSGNRTSKITIRKKKQWFNKSFLLEVKKLSNILAKQYAHNGLLLIKEIIEEKKS